jgi:hypothetical protein
MTNPEILKLKMIAAMLETIDIEDEDDAKQAVKLIESLFNKPAK